MDLSKLDDEQIKVALKVIAAAKKHGINPDFVLPMVNAESGFNPNAKSLAGAIGPMQLMPSTAKDLGVDPNNVDENIDGGMRFLKGLIENKKLKGDPHYIFAAYNAGPNAKFFDTGDLKDLPDETINHVVKLINTFGGQMPEMTQEAAPQAPADSKPEDQYSGDPIPTVPTRDEKFMSPVETGAIGAAVGTGAGSVYTAKAPIFRMAQRVGLLPGGRPISATDAAALVERAMTPGQAPVEAARRAGSGGENWQKALTGISTPGAQMDKASLDLAKGMQQTVGLGGAPGFTGGTISPGGIILNPRDAAAIEARQQAAVAQALERQAQMQQTIQRASQPSLVQRGAHLASNVMGSAPVRGALAGLGVGFNAQDAYNKFDEGDTLGGALSTGAAGASALGLVPKLAPVMGPAAAGLTTASQVASNLRRGDTKGATGSAYTGGLGTLATMGLSPLMTAIGALLPSRLNAGEEEELKRRRMMAPTLSP